MEFPLFLSVDYNSYRRNIEALHHKDYSDIANNILHTLPVYLVAHFGDIIWNWFTVEHRSCLDDTTWNPTTKSIETHQPDDLMTGLYGGQSLQDWEQVNTSDLPAIGNSSITVNLPSLLNFERRSPESGGYDDANSLATCATGTSNATDVLAQMPIVNIDASEDDKTDLSHLSGSIASSNGPNPANGASGQRAAVSPPNVK